MGGAEVEIQQATFCCKATCEILFRILIRSLNSPRLNVTDFLRSQPLNFAILWCSLSISSPFPHSLSISSLFAHSLSIFSQPGCQAATSCATLSLRRVYCAAHCVDKRCMVELVQFNTSSLFWMCLLSLCVVVLLVVLFGCVVALFVCGCAVSSLVWLCSCFVCVWLCC